MTFNEKNNSGIANEINFATKFNKKLVNELDENSQALLYTLFDNLKPTDYIESWKSKFNEKADIKIRINGDIKGISIKIGNCNSVHQEHIDTFSSYLLNIGISNYIVDKIKAYINGTINGIVVDAKTYKEKKKNDIIEIKNALADLYIKICLIIRFLFKGQEGQIYDADAIIHGTPSDFYWATKSEVLEYLISYPDGITINVKIGPLFIQCRNRNLKNNLDSMYAKDYIQIKWYNLKKDLYFITKKRKNTKNVQRNDKKIQ